MGLKENLTKILEKQLKESIKLETPQKPEFGDFSLPCFKIGDPQDILKKLKLPKYIERIEIIGKYINLYLNKEKLAKDTITRILKEKDNYSHSKIHKERILIESPGPNTNKPLHLGHLRNMVIGISLVNLQKAIGNDVIPVDIVNDRGIHIAKSALAYQKYGKNKKPNKKPDHFVGDFYVLFANNLKTNPKLEEEAHELLKKYEKGDKKTVELFKKMNKWALHGFKQTYDRIGVKIKKTYLESTHYKKGREIIMDGLKKGIFKKDKEGNIIIDLNKEGMGEKVLLRADSTSIYITQDIYLALKRYNDYKMNKMVYVVASEQTHHFKVLFKVLEALGYGFSKNLYHLAYGMVYLPGGRMKSREGNVVDADNLLDEVHSLSKEELKKRRPKLSKKETKKRAEYISQAAIKFFLLKYDVMKDFTFYSDQALTFEGDTGPYIQYTYARGYSLLKKAKAFNKRYKFTNKEEQELIKLLSEFPEIVHESAIKYKPNILAQYILVICHVFNEFYQKYPILKAEKDIKESRLNLVKATIQVLKNGLNLLGINVLREM